MKFLIIAKNGFKDIAFGTSPDIQQAFDNVCSQIMHYAIEQKIITNGEDQRQIEKAFATLKPHFEFKYVG